MTPTPKQTKTKAQKRKGDQGAAVVKAKKVTEVVAENPAPALKKTVDIDGTQYYPLYVKGEEGMIPVLTTDEPDLSKHTVGVTQQGIDSLLANKRSLKQYTILGTDLIVFSSEVPLHGKQIGGSPIKRADVAEEVTPVMVHVAKDKPIKQPDSEDKPVAKVDEPETQPGLAHAFKPRMNVPNPHQKSFRGFTHPESSAPPTVKTIVEGTKESALNKALPTSHLGEHEFPKVVIKPLSVKKPLARNAGQQSADKTEVPSVTPGAMQLTPPVKAVPQSVVAPSVSEEQPEPESPKEHITTSTIGALNLTKHVVGERTMPTKPQNKPRTQSAPKTEVPSPVTPAVKTIVEGTKESAVNNESPKSSGVQEPVQSVTEVTPGAVPPTPAVKPQEKPSESVDIHGEKLFLYKMEGVSGKFIPVFSKEQPSGASPDELVPGYKAPQDKMHCYYVGGKHLVWSELQPKNGIQVDQLRRSITKQVVHSVFRSKPNDNEIQKINQTIVKLMQVVGDDYQKGLGELSPELMHPIVKKVVANPNKDMTTDVKKAIDYDKVWKEVKSTFDTRSNDHVELTSRLSKISGSEKGKLDEFFKSFKEALGAKGRVSRSQLFSKGFDEAMKLHAADPASSALLLANLKKDKAYDPAKLCKAYVSCMQNIQDYRQFLKDTGKKEDFSIVKYFIRNESEYIKNHDISDKSLKDLRKIVPTPDFLTAPKMELSDFAKEFRVQFPKLNAIITDIVSKGELNVEVNKVIKGFVDSQLPQKGIRVDYNAVIYTSLCDLEKQCYDKNANEQRKDGKELYSPEAYKFVEKQVQSYKLLESNKVVSEASKGVQR